MNWMNEVMDFYLCWIFDGKGSLKKIGVMKRMKNRIRNISDEVDVGVGQWIILNVKGKVNDGVDVGVVGDLGREDCRKWNRFF